MNIDTAWLVRTFVNSLAFHPHASDCYYYAINDIGTIETKTREALDDDYHNSGSWGRAVPKYLQEHHNDVNGLYIEAKSNNGSGEIITKLAEDDLISIIKLYDRVTHESDDKMCVILLSDNFFDYVEFLYL